MGHDELLTSTQVGAIIGRSGRTVSRMADVGKLQAAQKLPGPNGAYLFRRADVARYLLSEATQESQPNDLATPA